MRNKLSIFGLCLLMTVGYTPIASSADINMMIGQSTEQVNSGNNTGQLGEDEKRRRVRPPRGPRRPGAPGRWGPRRPGHPGGWGPRRPNPPRRWWPRPPTPPFPVFFTRSCTVGYQVYARSNFTRVFRTAASSRWSYEARRLACARALNACIQYKRAYHRNLGHCIVVGKSADSQ